MGQPRKRGRPQRIPARWPAAKRGTTLLQYQAKQLLFQPFCSGKGFTAWLLGVFAPYLVHHNVPHEHTTQTRLETTPPCPFRSRPSTLTCLPAPSAQQDLYAAGVTLYHLLTGHYPYGEIEAFQHPRFTQPIAASRYCPEVPVWLDECLNQAVAANPQKRFATAEQWLLCLERGEHDVISRRPRPLLEREPLKVWRGVALLSLLLNLLLAIALLHG